MASSIIHLAAAAELTAKNVFRDPARFRLGSVLPDGSSDRDLGHLRVKLPGDRRTYDADAFRRRYMDRILADDLWLGYYLHLVQDLLFRRFMYAERGWDPTRPGYVQRLHSDYAVTNAYVIRRHGLTPDMVEPPDPVPDLDGLGSFDIPRFVDTVRGYFVPVGERETFSFTADMAEEYLSRAVALSQSELDALRSGAPLIDSRAWSWYSAPPTGQAPGKVL